jgi:hypothetical protein
VIHRDLAGQHHGRPLREVFAMDWGLAKSPGRDLHDIRPKDTHLRPFAHPAPRGAAESTPDCRSSRWTDRRRHAAYAAGTALDRSRNGPALGHLPWRNSHNLLTGQAPSGAGRRISPHTILARVLTVRPSVCIQLNRSAAGADDCEKAMAREKQDCYRSSPIRRGKTCAALNGVFLNPATSTT